MSQTEIQEVELSIETARKMVERGQMAEKLAEIPEFRTLVLEGYFVEEASRLALLFSDPNLPEDARGHVLRDLNGVGAFKRYLSTLVQIGHQAQNEIEQAQLTLQEMRAEEFNQNAHEMSVGGR